MQKYSTLNKEESATAWFYRILRNAVIDHYHHRAAEDRALKRWASALIIEDHSDPAMQNIVCHSIEQVLPTIKPHTVRSFVA